LDHDHGDFRLHICQQCQKTPKVPNSS
jgi:hypothetical protein